MAPALGAVSPATPGPGRRAMKGRVCFIAPSVSAGHGSARTPTDKDKVRFGFLLPLPVERRSIRRRAPIPSRARKEARAPGRGPVDQEQGQEQEHDWPRPRCSFSGDSWTGTPGDERTCVFHSPTRQCGVWFCVDTQDPSLQFSRPRRPSADREVASGDLAGGEISAAVPHHPATPSPVSVSRRENHNPVCQKCGRTRPTPALGGCWLVSSWVRTHSRTHLR